MERWELTPSRFSTLLELDEKGDTINPIEVEEILTIEEEILKMRKKILRREKKLKETWMRKVITRKRGRKGIRKIVRIRTLRVYKILKSTGLT